MLILEKGDFIQTGSSNILSLSCSVRSSAFVPLSPPLFSRLDSTQSTGVAHRHNTGLSVMKGLRSRSMSQFDKNPFDVMPDEFVDQRSIDGTSSTASFDRFCADILGEGPLMDGPCDPFWDADDSSTSASVDSSPLGWPSNTRDKSRLAKLHSLPRIVNNKRAVEWDEDKDAEAEAISDVSEIEMMKDRFAKLLLGEDLSGGGKGVSSALAISNAITNLSASVFGELYRVEPLSQERKARWKREMGWLLSVCDHIVEFVPQSQALADGSVMEVMVTKQRSDLHMNLPALRKLDAMLMDSLDGFTKPEFYYADRARDTAERDGDMKRQDEKWWLPTPRVPSDGLSQEARKQLQQQRESINQILKAALAINAQILSEMEVPSIYWDALPKNGRSSLGEGLYRTITSENFSPDALIATIDSNDEHNVLELVNCVEAAIHIWRRKLQTRQIQAIKDGKNGSKSSWGLSKEGAIDPEKREMLAEKAKGLLLLLRHKFPGLPQTILDINKIQYNKDVGQSILESYSRVLESLAFNILSRIDDVLRADDAAKSKPHQSLSRTSSVHKSKDNTHFSGLSKSASTHVVGSMSPTRSSQNKSMSDYGHWGVKTASKEFSLEQLNKSPPPFGQKWSYSGNMNAMQSPPSRD
ncbi:hypothetical protein GOP47_0012872 [Adiantum capillus-veneris]|uniref:PRONE domain-containing protein n=1 Tax=Adiantum capillus-veneris TaxID=13818 RepID=A0A9D4US35_ADICA|nr:hypothetical protein GOP47_0012872 [Adiantum capillus-veneris]